MKRYRRRAYSIVLVIAFLPLMASVATVAWLLAARTIKVEGRERQFTMTNTVARDVVRRIQTDAREAAAARIGPNGAGELTLELPGQRVVYRSLAGKMTRTCTASGAAPVVYEWKLPDTQAEFLIETIGGSRGLVWITVTQKIREEAAPRRNWRLSAAAPVGRGGTP